MRRKDREITDNNEIDNILTKARVLHLGLNDNGYPYVVPLHYGFERNGSGFIFYMHCAKEGHKLELIEEDPRATVEIDCGEEIVSGGEIPCHYGARFFSFMGRGTVSVVTDETEKIVALELLMRTQTGKEFAITGDMAETVEVLKFITDIYSAKARK